MAEELPKFSIVKLIPITALITIISQITIITYYNNFNFSPITYFESYEIIIASIKDFIILACLFFVNSILCYSFVFPIMDIRSNKKSRQGIKSIAGFKEKTKNLNYSSYKLLTFATGITIAYITIDYFYPSAFRFISAIIIFFISFMVYISCLFRFEVLSGLRNSYASYIRTYFPYIQLHIFAIVGLMLVYSLLLSNVKSDYIFKHNPYKGSILITPDSETVRCTSKVLFIGKSQKYYFIYNTPDSSVRVIEREGLKKEVIKIKKNTNLLFRF